MENNQQNSTNINWYPGHMAKARREIQEKINLIDIFYEVIDARMPISSKIPFNDIIKDKKRIIIVSKYDLCDKEKTNKYLNEYKKECPIFIFNLKKISNSEIKKLIETTNLLLKDINIKRKEKGLKPRLFRAMVIGAPNVGKSTLINKIKGKNITKTANKPGVTKNFSWIKVKNTIELMDTPGLLYPKITNPIVGLNLASLNSINEYILDKEEIASYILEFLFNNYKYILIERYKVTDLNKFSLEKILLDIVKSTNSYKKGNVPDYEKVYQIIINDLKEGKINNVTFDI